MKEIHTKNAPAAVGPYSQAIVANGFVFCAGQIGLSPKAGALVTGGVAPEARQALKNLEAVLKEAQSSLENVMLVHIYLTVMDDFVVVNEVYARAFKKKPYPARVTVGVASLPKNARVEISCIALTKTV